MKILLHTCCGPCFLGVWGDLKNKDFEVTNYFYNSNIYPADEYTRRLAGLSAAALHKSKGIIEADYEPEKYAETILGKENFFPRRCLDCYRLRLQKTAEYAKTHGFDAFSTTLLVSPYQQHEKLRELGEKIAEEFKIKFYYYDWRPHFRAGQSEAKELDIYRQKYCGCVYSLNQK